MNSKTKIASIFHCHKLLIWGVAKRLNLDRNYCFLCRCRVGHRLGGIWRIKMDGHKEACYVNRLRKCKACIPCVSSNHGLVCVALRRSVMSAVQPHFLFNAPFHFHFRRDFVLNISLWCGKVTGNMCLMF